MGYGSTDPASSGVPATAHALTPCCFFQWASGLISPVLGDEAGCVCEIDLWAIGNNTDYFKHV